jgi:hypothetical protein
MSENKESANKEIDLLELIINIFRTLGELIVSTGRILLSWVIFLFRKWIPLLISVMVGIGITYFLKIYLPPVYSTEMTCRTNAIPDADMIAYINRLHSFCLTKNINALSESLSLPAEKAEKITDIQAFWVIDKNDDATPDYVDYKNRYNVYDTINLRMQDRFVVRARFTALNDLSVIREGILSYIKNNPLFRERNNVRLRQIDELTTRYNYDIKQLDSLQKIKYYEETKNMIPGKTGQMVFLQEQKTQLVYEDIYKLYEQKQGLEIEKAVYSDIISTLSDFAIPVKPFTGMVYYGKYIIPIFLILTLIILILVTNAHNIRELFRKY